MKHSIVILCGLFLVVLGVPSDATILLYDTWADASRLETNLPDESAVWVSAPDAVTMGTGSLAYEQSTSSRRLWTYFTPDGSPVSLGIGEQLIATIEFTPRGALYDTTSRNFRFGLFNDPTDGQILADGATDAGGAGNPWADSTGYAVQIALTDGTGTRANVGKRIPNLHTSLLGSNTAYPGQTNAGENITATLDTLYTLTLVLDRVADSQMQVSFAFADALGVISTHSILDDGTFGGHDMGIYTQFDQLAFRFSSASGTADVIDFHSIKIEYIPEPGTLVLLGLGAAGVLRRRYSR